MHFFDHVNTLITTYCVCPAILLLGLYLTFSLRFIQIAKLKASVGQLFKKNTSNSGAISHFQAVAAVLASNFGTGNISGMAVALTTGGPGALVWMWVMAFFGSAIQFASCVLGVKYRQKDQAGGPMYYLSQGLGFKSLAVVFSIFVILAAITVGNFVQANSVALPLADLGISPWVTGLFFSIFAGVVILGGASRVAKVSAKVVPTMALLYLGAAVVVLGMYAHNILPALGLLFRSAFSGSALAGGVMGYGVLKALSCGFNRAIFATDAGTGTAPILQAGARTTHAVESGLVTLIAPFLVMIVCTMTALALLVTGVFAEGGLQSTNMVVAAFSRGLGGGLGRFVVLTALALFGYTTILAWASCLEKAAGYLFGRRVVRLFQIFYIALLPFGAAMHVDFVWTVADMALTTMLILNLIGVLGLSREVVLESRAYFSVPENRDVPIKER